MEQTDQRIDSEITVSITSLEGRKIDRTQFEKVLKVIYKNCVGVKDDHDNFDVEIQLDAIVDTIKLEAEQGNHKAQMVLGLLHFPEYPDESFYWLQRSVNSLNVDVPDSNTTKLCNDILSEWKVSILDIKLYLGMFNALGIGTQMNRIQAAQLFKEIAHNGHPEGQYKYDLALFNGDGVPVDRKEAMRWIRLAAKGGHQHAIDHLAKWEELYEFHQLRCEMVKARFELENIAKNNPD